jgi:hypothetical protein
MATNNTHHCKLIAGPNAAHNVEGFCTDMVDECIGTDPMILRVYCAHCKKSRDIEVDFCPFCHVIAKTGLLHRLNKALKYEFSKFGRKDA